MTSLLFQAGDRVKVTVEAGGQRTDLHGKVARTQSPGPRDTSCTVKVIFDDPLVWGGMGFAWIDPKNVEHALRG